MTYTPIDPSAGYDFDQLKDGFSKLSQIEGGLEALTKDRDNPGALTGLGNALRGSSNFYYSFDNPSSTARLEGDLAARDGRKKLEEYVFNNNQDVLNGLNDEKRKILLRSVKLETNGNPEYDEFVSANNKLKELDKIAKGEGDIGRYVTAKLAGAQDWQKSANLILSANSKYTEALARDYIQEDYTKINAVFEKYNDKLAEFSGMARDKAIEKNDKSFFGTLGQIAVLESR
jgi:hypothetical protein